jgi:DNA-binding FadR family transcriptional regulator
MPVEHRNIVEAIRSGDGEAARRVSDNHVKKLKEFVAKEGAIAFAEHN